MSTLIPALGPLLHDVGYILDGPLAKDRGWQPEDIALTLRNLAALIEHGELSLSSKVDRLAITLIIEDLNEMTDSIDEITLPDLISLTRVLDILLQAVKP